MEVLTHGVGGRQDLPVPFTFAVTGALIAVSATMLVLALAWRRPRYEPERPGWPLPDALAVALDSPALRLSLKALGLMSAGYVAVAAWFGPDDALNPTAGAIFVLFWVGLLAFGSALLGPLWPAMNPLRTLHEIACFVIRRDPNAALVRYPEKLGVLPGVLALMAFLWLELAAPQRSSAVTLREFALAYAISMWIGAAVFGRSWFRVADGFEIYSRLFGALSVLSRRSDGVLILRNPLASVAQVPAERGLGLFLCVMLGATAFDGLTSAPEWIRFAHRTHMSGPWITSLGLISSIVFVALLYFGSCWACAQLAKRDTTHLADAFAPSLIPIAFGYVVAHYYSFFVLSGQEALVRLSDPLGSGADLLATANLGVSDAWVMPTATAVLAVAAVTIGHVCGAVSGHDKALSEIPNHRPRVQLPLMVAMVAYTWLGLSLLFAT